MLEVAVLSAALILPTFLFGCHPLSFAQQFDCCLICPFVSSCLQDSWESAFEDLIVPILLVSLLATFLASPFIPDLVGNPPR